MIVYHGREHPGASQPLRVSYDADVVIFRRDNDRLLQYRSTTPILVSELQEETSAVVDNVVFPTGIDKRSEDVYDIYYGVADKHLGVARLHLPAAVDSKEAPQTDRSSS